MADVEVLEGWKRRLALEISAEDVKRRADELLTGLGKKAELKGFRKGKVPRDVLERRYGDSVRVQAMEDLLGNAYESAVRETGVYPVSDPIVEEAGGGPEDGVYRFTATFEVRPEIELSDYEGLEFTERVPLVTDEDVAKAVDEIREQNAELLAVSRPAGPGDFAIIDYDRRDENGEPVPDSTVEGYPCELGAKSLPPELEEALTGMSAGEEKSVTISYPKEHPSEALAGKDIAFFVRVKDVREKRLAPLDDDFARAVGKFETMLDLRVKVRTSLEAQAAAYARRRLEEEIVSELIRRNPFELPESLVQGRLARMYERANEGRSGAGDAPDRTKFDEVYRPVVEHQLKAALILGTISKKHEIDVTDEDIALRVAELAASQGKEPKDLLKDLEGTDALSQIKDEIWLKKTHEFITSISKITTEAVELPRTEPGDGEAADKAEGE